MRKPYRLTADFVRRIDRPGIFGDGRGSHGLQLRVHRTKGGDLSKSWRQMLRIDGKLTTRGLGAWPYVGLADARRMAMANRAALVDAVPNIAPVRPKVSGPTVLEAVEKVIELRRPTWKNGATEAAWRGALAHIGTVGAKSVGTLTSADVLRVIEPLHTAKPSVAKKLLDCIRLAAEWAIGHELRSDNPAKVAKSALPKRTVQRQHFAAVPHGAVRGVMERLAASRLVAAPLIRFVALTAVRHGEAAGARWSEIDMAAATWTIPAARMKGSKGTAREHRVPLSASALALLREQRERVGGHGLIFRNTTGNPVARDVCSKALRRVEAGGTVHGFRSSFRDWCAETGVAQEVAEACLAHVAGDVERAYRRGDLLARRRDVMERWSRYIAS